jgi:CHASE2 domain-containing sensor protein
MLLLQSPAMQFLSIQSAVSSDFTYNDLFYRVQSNSNVDNVARRHKEEIVLINTANLGSMSFRAELADLINRVESFKPKAVGIDIVFANRADYGNDSLLKSIQSYTNIVCSFRASQKSNAFLGLPSGTIKGDVDFPENQHSIRFYKGGRKTFAYQLFKLARGRNATNQVSSLERFPIAYSSIQDGVVDFDDFENSEYTKNYRVIDAKLMLSDEFAYQHYHSSLKQGIVIIGHIGTNKFDVEDRHAVPTDTSSLVNRSLLMPGAAIHANALSNMLDNHVFHEPNSFLVEIFLNIIMLIMVILILKHPLKIFMLIGLAVFSIVWIWLAMYLMEFNIYIQVGGTLIELMILEEFVDSFDPAVMRLWNRFRKNK